MGRFRAVWVAVAVFAAVGGVTLLVTSSDDADDDVHQVDAAPEAEGDDSLSDEEGPTLEDHWHTAFGVYVCGEFLPGRDNGRDPVGIHTHGDGLIHVHPFTKAATGADADLDLFFRSRGDRLDDSVLRWERDEWSEGTTTCNGAPGEVVVATPNGRVTTDVGEVRLLDCSWVTIAFVGEGDAVPRPPSADEFGGLSDVPPDEDVCTPSA